MRALVNSALIAEQSERNLPDIDAAELSAAADRFYSERGLRTIAAQDNWLRERGLTRVRLEGLLRDLLVRRKTEEKLALRDLETHRRERREEYLGIRAAQLVPGDALLGRASAALRESPGASLFELAGRLAWESGYADPIRIEFVELLRYELGESAEKIWCSKPGAVHQVKCRGGDWRLISLLAREESILEAALERRIVKRLVDDWCSEQRRAARIEWRWGAAEKP